MYVQFACVPRPELLPCSRHFLYILGPGMHQGQSCTQYLSCFHLLYNQVHHLLQQWVHIFPSTFCHPEALPVVSDITGPSEFQMGSGFPNLIPVSVLLPGYTIMYLPSLCFLFVFEFGQEPPVHQMSFGIFAWISAHWDRPLLSLEEVVAEYQLGILDPSSLYGPMC